MQNRRPFLLTAGALAVGSVGTVSANGRATGPSKQAVHNAVHRAVERGGAEEASRALDNLGVEATVQRSQDFDVSNREDVEKTLEDDSDVSTEFAYENPEDSDSEVVVSLGNVIGEDDQVRVSTSMSLHGCSDTTRNSWWIEDAIGVGFLHQDWAPVGEPSVSATRDHAAKFTEENVANDALAGTVTLENHNEEDGAVCASIPSAIVTLTGEFRLRDGGEPSTLWGSYSHTIAADPWASLEKISGGAGGISVSTGNLATTYWSIADPIDPKDAL